MDNVVGALQALRVTHLVSIGGDDTAHSAFRVSERAKGGIRVAHVPKTIDNDLPLPGNMPTFGFTTATHVGGQLVANLVRDARATRRSYVVVAMGRTAGHLALGIALSGGASAAVIPEQLSPAGTRLDLVCSMIEGTAIKAATLGQDYSVTVVAEGLVELIREDLERQPLVQIEEEPQYERIRLSDVPLGLVLKRRLLQRAEIQQTKRAFVDVTIGYELRCADPVSYDAEYTQQLGCAAVQHLLRSKRPPEMEGGVMICLHSGDVEPIPLANILDPATGKIAVRRVDTASESYRRMRSSMIRLEPHDLNAAQAERLATEAGLPVRDFLAMYSEAARAGV